MLFVADEAFRLAHEHKVICHAVIYRIGMVIHRLELLFHGLFGQIEDDSSFAVAARSVPCDLRSKLGRFAITALLDSLFELFRWCQAPLIAMLWTCTAVVRETSAAAKIIVSRRIWVAPVS